MRPLSDIGLSRLIGGVFDPIVSVVEDVADVATSAFDRIPGSEVLVDTANVLSGPIKDFAEGPMRDFARTSVGETIFRAASIAVFTAAYTFNPALGPYVFPWLGPTLALASMSIPGLAQGDAFDEALAKEAAYRLAYLVSVFSKQAGDEVAKKVGPIFSDQFGKAIAEGKRRVQEAFPGVPVDEALRRLRVQPKDVLDRMGLTPQDLARRLGIREDLAAIALGWLRRDPTFFDDVRKWYDPITGASTREAYFEAFAKELEAKESAEVRALYALAAADPCQAYLKATATNRVEIAAVLRTQCAERKRQDAVLSQMLSRNPCEAYVESVRLGRLDQALFRARCAEYKTRTVSITMSAPVESSSAVSALGLAALGLAALGGLAWFTHKGS